MDYGVGPACADPRGHQDGRPELGVSGADCGQGTHAKRSLPWQGHHRFRAGAAGAAIPRLAVLDRSRSQQDGARDCA
eukprot:6905512-Prorocentrum_lima.AAC.1